MKKKMTIPIFLVVLLVLIGCYFMIGDMQEKKAAQEADSTTYVTKIEDIVSLKYGSSDANVMSFVKKDDIWYYETDETISLDQSSVESMVSVFTNLVAVRTLEEPDALEDYGLEEAKYTLTLEDTSGNVTTVYVGNAVDGNYYVTINEKEIEYTVGSSIVDSMQFNIESLKEVEQTEETSDTEETTETE